MEIKKIRDVSLVAQGRLGGQPEGPRRARHPRAFPVHARVLPEGSGEMKPEAHFAG